MRVLPHFHSFLIPEIVDSDNLELCTIIGVDERIESVFKDDLKKKDFCTYYSTQTSFFKR